MATPGLTRSVPLLSPPSRCSPIVVFEDTSQPFSTLDGTVHVGLVAPLLNQLVVETLVISLKVVMLHVFLHSFSKVWDFRASCRL